jgi:hypothetical protein
MPLHGAVSQRGALTRAAHAQGQFRPKQAREDRTTSFSQFAFSARTTFINDTEGVRCLHGTTRTCLESTSIYMDWEGLRPYLTAF